MMLPKDIPTLEASSTKNFTRVDNIFCSVEFHELFISCDTYLQWLSGDLPLVLPYASQPMHSTFRLPIHHHTTTLRYCLRLTALSLTPSVKVTLTTSLSPSTLPISGISASCLSIIRLIIDHYIHTYANVHRPCTSSISS